MDPVVELKQQLAGRRAVLVIGAGVSMAATRLQPNASWGGLLKNGIEQCTQPPINMTRAWANGQLMQLKSADTISMLSIATQVQARIQRAAAGEWASWLESTVGTLRADERALLDAIHALGARMLTTNYDGLLEEGTTLRPVTWQQKTQMLDFVQKAERESVLHLHGYWREPGSVILGVQSYDQILASPEAQSAIRSLATVNSLVFIGCGDGLEDPNFGSLMDWMRGTLANSKVRHFRLELNGDVEQRQVYHDRDRVVVLGYGDEHKELSGYLSKLIASRDEIALAPPAPSSSSLPPPRACFGRAVEIEELVTEWLSPTPRPTPILGTGGIGKSTISIQALHDPRVVSRYGARRYFVSCDAASSASAVSVAIATTLGLTLDMRTQERVLAELGQVPTVLVLDNAETPLDAEHARADTETFFARLAAIPVLALTLTIRGASRPGGASYRPSIQARPLAPDSARQLFLSIAGEKFAGDPYLQTLLEKMDGLPLALNLIAHVAEPEPSLKFLLRRWEEERTALLSRGEGKDLDLGTSIELSIKSPAMKDHAKRLLSILAALPNGVSETDVREVLPSVGLSAASILVARAVSYWSSGESRRLVMLTPIREYVAKHYPPGRRDGERAWQVYVKLASKLGDDVLTDRGSTAVTRLAPESENILAGVRHSLQSSSPSAAIYATTSLGDFFRVTGIDDGGLLSLALQTTLGRQDWEGAARCLFWSGQIASTRSDEESAQTKIEEARTLFQRTENILGEAACIDALGEIALRRSDHAGATEKFEEALNLYKRAGSVLGEANCIKGIGHIAFLQSDYSNALAKHEESLQLYRQAKDALGEANCIQSFGNVAFRRSDYDKAQIKLEEAAQLHQRVGDALGEANCIHILGEIALLRSDYVGAWAKFIEALQLYQRIGSVVGEGYCVRGLADVDVKRDMLEEALGPVAK